MQARDCNQFVALTSEFFRSSLIYNTCARHERHECDTSDTNVTRVQHYPHEWDTSATPVQHECYTNDTSAIQVKNLDFDNSTSKNIFSHPYIYYMASERLFYKMRNNFILRTTFWKCLFHAIMRLKSAPQKLNFLMEKATPKSCTLDCGYKCPCTFPHSYTQ